MNSSYAHITGWGMAVPERILKNDDIARFVDTDDEWIVSHTGIRERRIVNDDETSASLGTKAALRALAVANVRPSELDLIIVSTSSPEYIFPATACLIQDRIGATNAGAFDLSAACTGFIIGINMAAQAIKAKGINTALVIGTETLSRLVNWKDRNTCILFGDGAGAFVLQSSDDPGGYLSGVMHSDGSGSELLSLPGGGSRYPTSLQTIYDRLHYIHMNGKEVYRFATRVMAQASEEAVRAADLRMEDVQVIIPHQANIRIIEAAIRRLDYPMDQVVVNLERYGNTSTASIPIATCEAIEQGRLKVGDNVLFVAFGAGLTWGSTLINWSGPFPVRRKVKPQQYRWYAKVRSTLSRSQRRLEGLIWGRS